MSAERAERAAAAQLLDEERAAASKYAEDVEAYKAENAAYWSTTAAALQVKIDELAALARRAGAPHAEVAAIQTRPLDPSIPL